MPFLQGAQGTDASYSSFTDVGHDQYNINTTNNTYVNPSSGMEEHLATLKPVNRGGNDVRTCTKGTRASIFEEINRWLEDPLAPNILWLSGSPGAGKSAIAATLVSTLADEGRLGTSFFFRRGDAALSDPTPVWRTVAYHLARFHPIVAQRLVEDIKAGNPKTANIESHYRMVEEALTMKKALKRNEDDRKVNKDQVALANHHQELEKVRFVIVFDALDECGWEPSQSDQRQAFIDSVTEWSSLPSRFKLIVTSRDERLPQSFRRVCKQIELLTGSRVTAEAGNDINLFFRARFAAISERFPRSLSAWPDESTIKQLTALAAGHFVWAETVVRFVDNGMDTPDEQLRLVLNGELGDEKDIINSLYRWILDVSFKKTAARLMDAFRTVVGTIVLAKAPLHRDDLRQFVGPTVSEVQVDLILNKLSSVISEEQTDGLLHICHLSFAEYLCDSSICPELFRIDRIVHSRNLAFACFRFMKEGLGSKPWTMNTHQLLNINVPNATRQVQTTISSRLSYSCCFWAEHLCDTPHEKTTDTDFSGEIGDFLRTRLLSWLEVMTSIRKESVSLSVLPLTLQWIGTSDSALSLLIAHASSVVVKFWMPLPEGCMEGTREDVFKEIDIWLEDCDARNILLLSGPAGIGKSTIASTLVSRLAERRQLGSWFFFRRGHATFSDPNVVWRTVAFDLASFHSAITDRLASDVTEWRVDPSKADLELHFKFMVEEALTMQMALKRTENALNQNEYLQREEGHLATVSEALIEEWEILSRSREELRTLKPVVILDALDECSDGEAQRSILSNTLVSWSHLPREFKLILTSRNDRIPQALRDVCHSIELRTGGTAENAENDIRRYLKTRLARVAIQNPSLPPDWPGDDRIKQLTACSEGLFIWAATAVQFVEGGPMTQNTPEERLHNVLDSNPRETATDALHRLYRTALDGSFMDPSNRILEAVNAVLGTIVVAEGPLRRDELSALLGSSVEEPLIAFVLTKLSWAISQDGGILRVYHSSFIHFLCDPMQCDSPFAIDRTVHNRHLASACLRLMKEHLRFNIYDLKIFQSSSSDISDLPDRIRVSIGPGLSYSCRFWAEHICSTLNDDLSPDDELLNEVKDFLASNLFHWLVVMSLIREVPAASVALFLTSQWIGNPDTELSTFAVQARKLVDNFSESISADPFYIYEMEDELKFSPQFRSTPQAPTSTNEGCRTQPEHILMYQPAEDVHAHHLAKRVYMHSDQADTITSTPTPTFVMSPQDVAFVLICPVLMAVCLASMRYFA